MQHHPSYIGVFLTCARNSLIRDMSFRANFLIELISSMAWMLMNLGFYTLIYAQTAGIPGWQKYQFFVFISTTMFVNSLVQAFFMPNVQELSELVRTGGLDFALLKPIDTQFLVSMRRIVWSSLGNFMVALALLAYSLPRIDDLTLTPLQIVLYPIYVVLGVLILYSVMITLAATSIWLGRNQSLYDFWFYITNFSRYPMEIYSGNYKGGSPTLAGRALYNVFTFVIPILVVINVPANVMAKPFSLDDRWMVSLALFAILATVISLAASRWIFQKALWSYRSASS